MADRDEMHPGYWPSRWPVECGGNRRQKASGGALGAAGSTPIVTTRTNGRWNVMVVEREPDEVFLAGTMAAFTGDAPYGWVERIDPETLHPISASPRLPCGDHVWCGAVLAHANGSIFNINGSHLHRLNTDLEVIGELVLPADGAHNGLLALSDGTLVTKDLRLEGQGRSTLTRVDPEAMSVIGEPLRLPEGSMGRIAADRTDDGDDIYVPGIEHLWRIRVEGESWTVDSSFDARYRSEGGTNGLAWDSCLSGGDAWLMDNGDIAGVRAIFSRRPNGRFDSVAPRELSWQHPAPWPGAQRLLAVDLDSGDVRSIEPFGVKGGGIIAPPVHVPDHGITVCWDSINGGLAGVAAVGDLEVAWRRDDVRATMQPVVYPDSGELVINDFRDGADHLVVVDVRSGELLSRVHVGSRLANGMFLTPGSDGDVYYCSTLVVARVSWA